MPLERLRTPLRHRPSALPGASLWRRLTRKTSKKKVLKWVGISAAGLFILGCIGVIALFIWSARALPDPRGIANRRVEQSTRIYDRTGTHLLYEIHGDKKRTVVAFDQIPQNVKWATISAEDREFYHHKGFDVRGILRAMLNNIVHLNLHGEGGSTITQQFIKNSILTNEKSFTRKLKELILAYQIERKFSKDEILGLYLNEIPYGSNAYGVEAASETFFGKDVKDLSLAESAALAALPQRPTYFSPFGNNTDALFARQQYILDVMAKQGYITQAAADAAKQEKVTFIARREGIIAPHFVFYVKGILEEKYGESVVENGGLKVLTTLDVDNQKAAEDAVAEYGDRNQKQYHASNAALVSLNATNGQILAMVGSRDYFDTAHDGNVNVTLQPRQPGSSFKPIVYMTAFDRGYTPDTMLFDLTTNFGTGDQPYTPHNYDGQEHGPVSMRKALAGSLNIPAVKTLYLAGVNNVLDVADRLGYTTLKDRSRYGLSLVLGGAEVRLLDHVSAYATLAREGMRNPTVAILKVEDKNGKTLEQFTKKETRVINEETVRKVTSVLTDNDARSFVFGSHSPLILPDRVVAAKTGTTNDFHDGWTMGYTPSIATGVWVGNNDNAALVKGADGVVVAAPIWNSYMRKVTKGTPAEVFKAPKVEKVEKGVLAGQIDTVQKLPVDKATGKIIPESCRDTYPAQFIVMKDFKETHDILYWVDKNNPRGPVPSNPTVDPQFSGWEGPVARWATAHGYPDLKHLQYERCDLRNNTTAPTVTLTTPVDGATLTSATNTFSATATASGAVTSVTFTLDGVTIGTNTKAPYQISYTNTQFLNGVHTVQAIVTDDLAQTSTASATITYALGADARILTVSSPQANAVFSLADFPIDITVHVFDPLDAVTLTALRGTTTLASTTSAAGVGTLHITTLPVGTQTLTIRALMASGDTLSTTLPLTVR